MAETERINVVSIVGNNICVAAEDGEKIYRAIVQAFQEGKHVKLSFKDVEDLTSLFLNAAVGQLYGTEGISEQDIKTRLSVVDVSSQDLDTLARSVERAKEYFKDPERFHSAASDVLGDEDESDS